MQTSSVTSETEPFQVFAGNVVNDSGLVIKDGTNSGYVKEATLSAGASPYNVAGATIYGLAMYNSQAIFVPAVGASKYATPFGVYSNSNTALQPQDPTSLKVALFHNGNQFSFSLDPAINLTQSLIGTTIGLASTGSSNGDIWYATTTGTGTCLCATIVRIVQGPGYSVIGTDTGGRLILEFTPSFLAV
jgi:hypothetical protein